MGEIERKGRASDIVVEERRAQELPMLLKGETVRDLMVAFGISKSVAYLDIAALREELKTEFTGLKEKAITQFLGEIQLIYRKAWEIYDSKDFGRANPSYLRLQALETMISLERLKLDALGFGIFPKGGLNVFAAGGAAVQVNFDRTALEAKAKEYAKNPPRIVLEGVLDEKPAETAGDKESKEGEQT
jgi:hypothetical protein